MPFSATTFIFDGTPSEFFNLYLGELDGDGVSSMPMSNDVSLITEKIFRRPVPFLYGAEQTPVLEFSISCYFPGFMDSTYFSEVSAWLFGQQEYKELIMCQTDMTDVYFNCFLTSPQVSRVGNLIRGFTATVICDAPWGWKTSKTYTETTTPTPYTFTIFNYSGDSYYTQPTSVVATFDNSGGSGSIYNDSDASRETALSSITANDVITMNSDLQTISASSGDTAMLSTTKFNYNWLRLVRGHNVLRVTGNIISIVISSPVAVKIG